MVSRFTDGWTDRKKVGGGGGRHSSPTSSFPTHGICDSEVPGEISASYLDSTRRRLAAGEFVAGLVFLGTFVLIPLDFCPDGRKQKHIPLCTARLPSLSHKNRKTFSGTQILENYRCRISHPHRVLPPNREMHPAFSFTTLTSTAFYHHFSHHALHEVEQKPRMTMDRDVGNSIKGALQMAFGTILNLDIYKKCQLQVRVQWCSTGKLVGQG